MAKIIYNKNLKIDTPTLLLKKRDFTNIGAVTASEITYKNYFNSPNELSFKVYKFTDNQLNTLWDDINDYNILYIPEFEECFEIHISLTEETGTYKVVTCTSLAESELSQTKLYDIEINTDEDMARPDYDENFPTLFYRNPDEYNSYEDIWNSDEKYIIRDENGNIDEDKTIEKRKDILRKSSLLHRILEKASNYSIGDVDDTLKNCKDWYQFSISDTNIYDELTGEIAEQHHCIFKFDSVNRTVSAYDLYNTCYNEDCAYRKAEGNKNKKYRGDFADRCPECGSTDIHGAYGKDTTIFVSKDNLSASASIESNKDSLKNCFRIAGGDDLMTAAVSICNPNGSNYIYYFSEEVLANMPEILKNAINDYLDRYNQCLNEKEYNIPQDAAESYNDVVSMINNLYPEEDEDNQYKTIPATIVGYKNIPVYAYEAIDLNLKLQSEMYKTPDISGEGMEKTMEKLSTDNLSPIAISDPSSNAAGTLSNNAILAMCKVYVNTALYKVNIEEYTYAKEAGIWKWKGRFRLTNIKDTTDTLVSELIAIEVNSDEETYLKQKMEKKLAEADSKVQPLTKMIFADDYNDDIFKQELKYYSFDYLSGLVETFNDTKSVLLDSDNAELTTRYNSLLDKCSNFVTKELEIRKTQLAAISALYYYGTDENANETGGILNTYINEAKQNLNFQDFLTLHSTSEINLWNLFCSYRREDSYQNDHYFSDGLSNARLMKRANELIEAAKKELVKAGTLQYNVTASLNNLLALEEFQPIVDSFECGNWIHLEVDGKIYCLRLLSYSINYDDLSKIDVEFSTVEKIWSGTSDIESVLSSASSIAGSYSATLSQVSNSSKSSKYVESWIQKGLDATATKIVNNADHQEIVIDKTGILCRKYDDIVDDYDPYQLKIISNGLYLQTKDKETDTVNVKTGIGKFLYLDPENNFQETVGYGVIADTVVGSLILGENLGIYSSNGSLQFTENGLIVKNGINTITINPNNAELFQIRKGSDSLFYTDDVGNLHVTGNITATNGDFMGSIHIGNNNFVVDTNGNITSKGTMSLANGGITYNPANGLNVTGKITATSGTFNGTVNATGGTFSNTITCNGTISGGTISGSNIIGATFTSKDGYFKITPDGKLDVTDAKITGAITANKFKYDDEDCTILMGEEGSGISMSFKSNYTGGISISDCFGSIEIFGNFIFMYPQKNFSGTYITFGLDENTGYFYMSSSITIDGNIYTDKVIAEKREYYVKNAAGDGNSSILGYTVNSTSKPAENWVYVGSNVPGLLLRGNVIKLKNTTGETANSDARLKNSFKSLEEFSDIFMDLAPTAFKYNNGQSGRYHFGFKAQDVRDAFLQHGYTTQDFGGFVQMTDNPDNEDYCGVSDPMGLIYTEFTAWNTHMIQKLYKENETLKQRITTLEQAMA